MASGGVQHGGYAVGLVPAGGGPGNGMEERGRLGVRQRFDGEGQGPAERVQPPAAGDDDPAVGGARQQGLHLAGVGRVVQYEQQPARPRPLAPHPGALRDTFRGLGDPGGLEQRTERLPGFPGRPSSVGPQVEEELRVGVVRSQPVGGVDGQGGLADAGHSVQQGDRQGPGHGRARPRAVRYHSEQGQFGRPPGEVRHVPRQGVRAPGPFDGA